jgi:hypothetical protein
MDKYFYAEASDELWPSIKSVNAKSYNDAVDIVITKYFEKFDDDNIINFDSFEDFREYLNENYGIALSDIEILEEL